MNQEIRFSTADSVLGTALVAESAQGVCAILLGDNARSLVRDLERQFPEARLIEARAELEPLVSKVRDFLATPGAELDLPLDAQGTDFQRRVWSALREIPAGATESYADVAARIGAAGRAKEVGEACAANVLAVAIPCHRVVLKDGGLAGYRWGVKRKRALLEREGALPAGTRDLFPSAQA